MPTTPTELIWRASRDITVLWPEGERPPILGDRKPGRLMANPQHREAEVMAARCEYYWTDDAGWRRGHSVVLEIRQRKADGTWGRVQEGVRSWNPPKVVLAALDAAKPTTRITITEE